MALRARVLFPRIAAGTLRLRASKAGRREPSALASFVSAHSSQGSSSTHIDFLARAHVTHLAKSEAT